MIANRREPTLGTFPEVEEIRTTTREANSSLYEPSSDEDSRRVVWLVVIIAGTAIGGLIAFFAARWYETRQIEVVLQSLARTVTDASVEAQREAARVSERLHLAQIEERKRSAAEAASREAARRHADETQARRIATANAESARREVAWKQFYRPSEPCLSPDSRASIECANEYARAKKEFDRQWGDGKL